MNFKDRAEAGKKLAAILNKFKKNPDTIVLGLPRGGVITAQAVADNLELPLDILVVRKIGSPNNEELAIGAISQDGQIFIDQETIANFNITPDYIETTKNKELTEANRRQKLYHPGKKSLDLKNKTVLLIDDGVATGATMRAAVLSSQAQGAKKIVVAIPIIARDTLKIIRNLVDEIYYLDAPFFFGAVGSFYKNFKQTTDEEVVAIMSRS